jgi:class 3 adenylate cyclase
MSFKKTIFIGASEDRLEKLIQKRLEPGALKEKIDKQIWDLFGEDWCVMFTDLSGFSRGVAKFGIIHFLQTIYESERIFIPLIEEHDGILLKVEGDSFLVIFRNAEKALNCAISMQQASQQYNQNKIEEEQILLCVGLGFGRVLRIGDEDVYGAEVNAASKLGEDYAHTWEIMATQATKDHVGNSSNASFEKISEIPPGAEQAYKVVYNL